MKLIALLALILELATLIVTIRREFYDNSINPKNTKAKAKNLWKKLRSRRE